MKAPFPLPALTDELALQLILIAHKRKTLERKRRGSGMKYCIDEGIGAARDDVAVKLDEDPAIEDIHARLRNFLELECRACEIVRCRFHMGPS
jgi:hypothetical protein